MFCEKCGNKIPDNAKFCAGCGAKVEQENGETVICKNCGNEFKKEFGVCSVCGTPTETNGLPVAPTEGNSAHSPNSVHNDAPQATVKRHTLKWWHILIISVSSVLVLCIIALSVTVIKPNGNGGMLQPGAATMDELIDTLAKNSMFSEKAISMMSNSMLWWMWEDELDQPNVMYGDTSEIRAAIKNEREEGFERIENVRVFVDDVKEVDEEELSNYKAELFNEKEHGKICLAETMATEKIFMISGYVKCYGERREFDFDDSGIGIIKANGRYYWCAMEIF